MILIEVSNCEMLTYKSTKTSVAKVSSKGKIVAVAPGSCGRRRFDQEITMAVMHVDAGRYQVEKIVIEP